MTLFDTHCHLQDPAFGDVEAVISRAGAAGVERMLVCGYDVPSSEAAAAMAARYEQVLGAAGIHPHDARDADNAALDLVAALAALPEAVAVGEIGLDFYRDLSPRDRQREALDAQLAIAVDARKPVSVHSRGAEDAIYDHLAAYAARSPLSAAGQPPGVMHCFGGTLEQAMRYVDIGFLVSVPCSVTYPANDEGRRVAERLPLASLVVETDSPYLPPQRLRGQRNEPANVRAAAEAVALARRLDLDEVAAAVTANAQRLFGSSVLRQAGATR